MKYSIIFLTVILLIPGCIKTKGFDFSEIKTNSDSRQKLFAAIIGDSDLLNEFLSLLALNEEGINQLVMDNNAMQHIFEMQNMHLIAQTKPEIMLMMVNNLAYLSRNDTSVRLMMLNLPQFQQIIREQEQGGMARK